jgi:hypothetical protein
VLAEFWLWSSSSGLGPFGSWIGRGGEKTEWRSFCTVVIRDVTTTVHRSQLHCLLLTYSNEVDCSNEGGKYLEHSFEWRCEVACSNEARKNLGTSFEARVDLGERGLAAGYSAPKELNVAAAFRLRDGLRQQGKITKDESRSLGRRGDLVMTAGRATAGPTRARFLTVRLYWS